MNRLYIAANKCKVYGPRSGSDLHHSCFVWSRSVEQRGYVHAAPWSALFPSLPSKWASPDQTGSTQNTHTFIPMYSTSACNANMYWCLNFRGISHQPCWVAPPAAASFSRPLLRLLLWIVVYLLTRQVLQMRVKMSYETHVNTPADERNHAFFFFFFLHGTSEWKGQKDSCLFCFHTTQIRTQMRDRADETDKQEGFEEDASASSLASSF